MKISSRWCFLPKDCGNLWILAGNPCSSAPWQVYGSIFLSVPSFMDSVNVLPFICCDFFSFFLNFTLLIRDSSNRIITHPGLKWATLSYLKYHYQNTYLEGIHTHRNELNIWTYFPGVSAPKHHNITSLLLSEVWNRVIIPGNLTLSTSTFCSCTCIS